MFQHLIINRKTAFFLLVGIKLAHSWKNHAVRCDEVRLSSVYLVIASLFTCMGLYYTHMIMEPNPETMKREHGMQLILWLGVYLEKLKTEPSSGKPLQGRHVETVAPGDAGNPERTL